MLEAVEPAPCREQRLLELVLRVLQRAEDPVAVQLQLRTVRVDELCEGGLVAGAGAAERALAQDSGPL